MTKFKTAQRTPVRARNLNTTDSSLGHAVTVKKEYSTSQFKKLGIYGFADKKTVFDTLFKTKTAAVPSQLKRGMTTVIKSPREKSNKTKHFAELADSPQGGRR